MKFFTILIIGLVVLANSKAIDDGDTFNLDKNGNILITVIYFLGSNIFSNQFNI